MSVQTIQDAVLDAFRVEHREQLEQIRALLATLTSDADAAGDSRLADAYRLAHSFKGGARVCDLRQAERLGHGLEAVFDELVRGALRFTGDVKSTINLVLNAIEDWMAAFEAGQPLPDAAEALTAIDALLSDAAGRQAARRQDDERAARLASAFRQEYAEHRARLGQLLAEWSVTTTLPDDAQLAVAQQSAHTLAGAAGVVGVAAIEVEARSLQDLFDAARGDPPLANAAMCEQLRAALAAMDAAMTPAAPPAPEAPADAPQAERALEVASATPVAAPGHDTVRVSVESLDRLMQASVMMLNDAQRVAHVTQQLARFQAECDELDRQRDTVRRAAGAAFHQLAAASQFAPVARYLEHVDRQVAALARRARQLFVDQRQSDWRLRARAAEVQRHAQETRMAPVHSVLQGFRKMVRDIATAQSKEVEFVVSGWDVRADRMVLQALKDPLMHVLRNSVTHGVETPAERLAAAKPAAGRVSLDIQVRNGRLEITVDDDGRGVNVGEIARRAAERGMIAEAESTAIAAEDALALVFQPGFSTSDSVDELAGRGLGLSIVHDAVARLQGQVRLAERPQGGVRVAISAPIAFATHRVLVVSCGQELYAVPTQSIERLLRVAPADIDAVEGQRVVMYDGRPIRVVSLAAALGAATAVENPDAATPIVLLKSGARLLAATVDDFVGERSGLLFDLDQFAAAPRFAGAMLLDDGRAVLVIDPADLLNSPHQHPSPAAAPAPAPRRQPPAERILIVDDSFTTRTLEKSILEAHGYQVSVAVDGAEALAKLRHERFALVISDIEMPRLDGFALLAQIKSDARLSGTPVILVTSCDRQEDQQRGLDLGAEAYIIKRKFDHQELLATIQQVL